MTKIPAKASYKYLGVKLNSDEDTPLMNGYFSKRFFKKCL